LLDGFIFSTLFQNVKSDSIISDSAIYWMLGGSAVFVSICGLLATVEKNDRFFSSRAAISRGQFSFAFVICVADSDMHPKDVANTVWAGARGSL